MGAMRVKQALKPVAARRSVLVESERRASKALWLGQMHMTEVGLTCIRPLLGACK